MHCEDFPGIAIRIRKPELILTSKATDSVLLDLTQNPLCLKTFLPGGNFFYGLDFDPQVVNGTQPSGRRYQREVQGRLGQIEFCVILRLLLRCHAKYLLIKRHRCRSEERRVGKECRSRWSP